MIGRVASHIAYLPPQAGRAGQDGPRQAGAAGEGGRRAGRETDPASGHRAEQGTAAGLDPRGGHGTVSEPNDPAVTPATLHAVYTTRGALETLIRRMGGAAYGTGLGNFVDVRI